MGGTVSNGWHSSGKALWPDATIPAAACGCAHSITGDGARRIGRNMNHKKNEPVERVAIIVHRDCMFCVIRCFSSKFAGIFGELKSWMLILCCHIFVCACYPTTVILNIGGIRMHLKCCILMPPLFKRAAEVRGSYRNIVHMHRQLKQRFQSYLEQLLMVAWTFQRAASLWVYKQGWSKGLKESLNGKNSATKFPITGGLEERKVFSVLRIMSTA